MSLALTETFERELSLIDVVAKYPEVPRLIIVKIDAQRRGVYYTDRALSVVDPNIHMVSDTTARELFGGVMTRINPCRSLFS